MSENVEADQDLESGESPTSGRRQVKEILRTAAVGAGAILVLILAAHVVDAHKHTDPQVFCQPGVLNAYHVGATGKADARGCVEPGDPTPSGWRFGAPAQ